MSAVSSAIKPPEQAPDLLRSCMFRGKASSQAGKVASNYTQSPVSLVACLTLPSMSDYAYSVVYMNHKWTEEEGMYCWTCCL